MVTKGLTDIFELNYDDVYKKVTSNSSVETIIKKVDQDKINILKKWMSENKITAGINIDEDSKRSYPYTNFASNLIGFCGTDNKGLSGLEATWNDVLTRNTSEKLLLHEIVLVKKFQTKTSNISQPKMVVISYFQLIIFFNQLPKNI